MKILFLNGLVKSALISLDVEFSNSANSWDGLVLKPFEGVKVLFRGAFFAFDLDTLFVFLDLLAVAGFLLATVLNSCKIHFKFIIILEAS